MNWKTDIKNYQSYLKIERGLSKNTIDNYSFDIERLCLFLEENSIAVSPIKISEEILQQFIEPSDRQEQLKLFTALSPVDFYILGKKIGRRSKVTIVG